MVITTSVVSFTYILDAFQRIISRLRMIIAGEIEVDRHGDPRQLFSPPSPDAVWYCRQDSTTSEARALRLNRPTSELIFATPFGRCAQNNRQMLTSQLCLGA
jgi:hypothetical protein